MQENEPHRDYKLAEEINTIVLRLVQLRDTHQHNIRSVKCEDYELDTLPISPVLILGSCLSRRKNHFVSILATKPPSVLISAISSLTGSVMLSVV